MLRNLPAGVIKLCIAEAFERFSYYTAVSVLVLFLVGEPAAGGLGWDRANAVRFYGTYFGALWLMPLFGGWIGDRSLGPRRAVITGALIMVVAQGLLLSPSFIPALVAKLTSIPIDKVLLQSGVPLGQLVLSDSEKLRLLAPLAAPGETYSAVSSAADAVMWAYRLMAYAFFSGLALLAIGVGFLKPNITVLLGQRYNADDPRRDQGFTLFYVAINVGGVLAGLMSGTLAERFGWSLGFGLAAAMMAAGAGVLVFGTPIHDAPRNMQSGLRTSAPIPRRPLVFVATLTAIASIFWGAFTQSGGLLNVFIFQSVDRTVAGFVVPAAWFVVMPPLCVVLLGPVFQALLDSRAKRGSSPDTITRFLIGLTLAAVAFLLLAAATRLQVPGQLLPILWPVAVYVVLAIAELSLSPAGNAMAARYVPPESSGRLMAIWFLCYGAGSVISGLLGGLYGDLSITTVLGITAGLLLASALVLAVCGRWLRQLITDTSAASRSQNDERIAS